MSEMVCPICNDTHRPAFVRFDLDTGDGKKSYIRPAIFCRSTGRWFVHLQPRIQGIGAKSLPLEAQDCVEVDPKTIKREDLREEKSEQVSLEEELPDELL